MTNAQYTEKILSSVERIIVDTSTLMTRGFRQFVCSNKERIFADGKKMIVPKAVYAELARHIDSEDESKSKNAMAAVELMTLNRDIFQVENTPLTDEEVAHAFADTQLLSELTLHRSDYNQLLITNDRKLSCDAFDLNQQQSCKGRKVLVCYINWCGELHCCDCVKASTSRVAEQPVSTGPENNTASPNGVPDADSRKAVESPWEFDWKSGLLSLSGAALIYCLYRNGKTFLRNIA